MLKYRHRILSILMAIAISLTLFSPITAYADGATQAQATGDSGNTIRSAPKGEGYPSYCKTGWLVYLVSKDGAIVSNDVVYVNSRSGFMGTRPTVTQYLVTRVGGRAPTKEYKNASGYIPASSLWGEPWTSGNVSNAKKIKAWCTKDENAQTIAQIIGDDACNLWKSQPDNYYLALEAVAYHKVLFFASPFCIKLQNKM